MKLYQQGPTPSCRRVSIFMKLAGIEVERIELNLKAGDNLDAGYVSRSINAKVPMLELDDGETISESVAICRYFDALQGTGLFGESALEKAKVEMWQRLLEWQGLIPAFQAFRNLTGFYSDRENCVHAWGEESKARITMFLPMLDKQLAQHPFVAGQALSIADITGFIFVWFTQARLDINVTQAFPNIARWYNTLSEMDAFQ